MFAPGTAPYPQQPVYQPMPNEPVDTGNQQSPQNPSAPRSVLNPHCLEHFSHVLQKCVFKNLCHRHTKRGIGRGGPGNPSFCMTLTKNIKR